MAFLYIDIKYIYRERNKNMKNKNNILLKGYIFILP